MTTNITMPENTTIEKFTLADLENLITEIVNKTISQNESLSSENTQSQFVIYEKKFDPNAKPISEIFAELAAEIPDEEWDLLPSNASELVDEYLYGVKR